MKPVLGSSSLLSYTTPVRYPWPFSFLYWTFSSIYTSCHNFSQRRKNPLNPTFLSSYHPISLPICREKKFLKRVAYAHFLQFLTSGMITFSPFILFGTHSYQLFPSTGIASVKLTCDLHFVKPSDQPTSLFCMTRQKHLTQLIISFSLNHNQDITFSWISFSLTNHFFWISFADLPSFPHHLSLFHLYSPSCYCHQILWL